MDKYKELIELLRKAANVKRLLAREGTYELLMQAADAIEELLNVSEKPTGLLPVGTDLDDIVDLGEYFFSINSNMEEKVNDLISRQAAIDEIDEWIKAFRENVHKESAADARFIRDGIIQLPSAQLWVPCIERLPEESGQYLTTVKYKHVDGYEDVYAEHGEWCDGSWDMFSFGHCGEVEDIIAWQPLPEPYKGGEK